MSSDVYRRRQPLHTCGVSLMDITRNVHKRAKAFNGPIGSITTKLSTLASPFLHSLLCHLLSFLSFLDRRILFFQSVVQAFFPPSTCLFDKIDALLQIVESLPAKFNDALDEFPRVCRRVLRTLFDWALVYAASWLDFWLFALANLLEEAATTQEKEITVVINCDESESRSPSCSEMGSSPRLSKGSYKEVLEKGTKESALVKLHENESDQEIVEKGEAAAGCGGGGDTSRIGIEEESVDKEEESAELTEKFSNGVEGNGDGGGGGSKMGTDDDTEDPVLSLFESAWQMKPSSTRG